MNKNKCKNCNKILCSKTENEGKMRTEKSIFYIRFVFDALLFQRHC